MSLTDDELERYARHIVLREVGGPGQAKLRNAKIAVVGAGGLGAPALMYLAAAGVGAITVIDDDTVSLSNLQRQVLFGTADVGRAKTDAATDALSRINPGCVVSAMPERLTEANADALLMGHDLILDGCDSFNTRYAVNAAAAEARIPVIGGAISQWEGQVSVWDPASGGPCYQCIFPEPPAPGLAPSCAEAGVMGALAGVVGSMMAGEAIKLITGAGEPLRGKMLVYDALWAENRVISLKKRSNCVICGAG